jgi:hypothetical protein
VKLAWTTGLAGMIFPFRLRGAFTDCILQLVAR